MLAVASTEERAAFNTAMRPRVAMARVASGGSGGGGEARSASFLVQALKLEARLKVRFDQEELAVLGAVTASRDFTLSSFGRRRTRLRKASGVVEARMKAVLSQDAIKVLDDTVAKAATKEGQKEIEFAKKAKKRKNSEVTAAAKEGGNTGSSSSSSSSSPCPSQPKAPRGGGGLGGGSGGGGGGGGGGARSGI